MPYCETWAIAFERIEAFFLAQDDLRPIGPGSFRGQGCTVLLVRLPDRPLGPLTVPQTRVEISGGAAEAVYRRFFLRFVSAGG